MNLDIFRGKREKPRKTTQVVTVTELCGETLMFKQSADGPVRFDANLLEPEGKQADNEASGRLL